MTEFFNTRMGKEFYEGTMKKVVVQLKRQADAAEKQNELLEKINANLVILAENAKVAPKEKTESDTPWLDGIANISIDNMDLSVRTYNLLNRAKICSLHEIINIMWTGSCLNEKKLLGIRNCGKLSAKEIVNTVKMYTDLPVKGLNPDAEAVSGSQTEGKK